MAEELSKIEKPAVSEFEKGRKLYFVPLIYSGKESPDDYLELATLYWEQVENNISDLETKLGKVARVFHELLAESDLDEMETIKKLSDRGYQIIKNRLDKGAKLETVEERDYLSELMDWSRCLAIGLENQKVFQEVYQSFIEISKKRNEYIAQRIDETLKEEEIGVLLMREGHEVQFPKDIRVFYIAPPALDEIRRWLRDQENRAANKEASPGEKADAPQDNA